MWTEVYEMNEMKGMDAVANHTPFTDSKPLCIESQYGTVIIADALGFWMYEGDRVTGVLNPHQSSSARRHLENTEDVMALFD